MLWPIKNSKARKLINSLRKCEKNDKNFVKKYH